MAGIGAIATANGRAESTIIDAVSGLCERGPILPCDGKRPIHDGWQHRTYSADEVAAELRRVADPMIGLRFGPGSYIDIEANSPDEGPGSGEHRLWLSIGGSAGHSSRSSAARSSSFVPLQRGK